MFQLLTLLFVQAQFIGFGFWSIWYSVFHVSPTIQKLDRTPVLVIRSVGCIYFIVRVALALFDIYNSKNGNEYADYYFGDNLIYSWIDVIWCLILSQLLWINFFLKSRWYRLFNGLLAIIPLSSINKLFDWYDGVSYHQYLIIKEVNIFVFYLINLSIYLMMMVIIQFFMDKLMKIKSSS
jgi:hypothetical protein